MSREIRISDLPSHDEDVGTEARTRPWNERLLTVGVPRGPRRTEWGVQLLAPDGRLLDERPVVRRYERFEFALHVNGSPEPASVSIVGDRQDPPDASERDEAIAQALQLEASAREAAAQCSWADRPTRSSRRSTAAARRPQQWRNCRTPTSPSGGGGSRNGGAGSSDEHRTRVGTYAKTVSSGTPMI